MSFAAAGIFTFPSRLLCKISSRTKQWILPGRKVSSGKPRVHLQAAVVAHPIASLISKTKPLPKSNGFNFQRRIPCRPSVSDFDRFLTPWHYWLQQDPTEPYWRLKDWMRFQIYSVYIVLDLSLEQFSSKKTVKKKIRLKQGKSFQCLRRSWTGSNQIYWSIATWALWKQMPLVFLGKEQRIPARSPNFRNLRLNARRTPGMSRFLGSPPSRGKKHYKTKRSKCKTGLPGPQHR